MTLLGTLALASGGGDYGTAALVPAGSLAALEPGDYLYAQMLQQQTNSRGLTVDVHFAL